MYVIVIYVSSKSRQVWNTWCVVCCCPRSPSSIFLPAFPTIFFPHSYASSVLLLPLLPPCHSIDGRLRTTSTRHRIPTDSTYVANRQPYPPAPQVRAGPHPTSHAPPLPNSRRPLSAPDPLLRSPLRLRVTCVHRQLHDGNGRRHSPKTRTNFSTTFSMRSSSLRRYSTTNITSIRTSIESPC
jgi:hypothetical protein